MSLKRFLQKRFKLWLNRRIPPSSHIVLNQRRIFIFPSRHGLYFLLVLLLLLIAAINYENNLVYLLFFLLLSLFNTAILFSYQNVSALTLAAGKTQAAFAGDSAEFSVLLSSLRKTHYQLHIGWPENPHASVDIAPNEEKRVKLYCHSQQRGMLNPGRILLESYYPLGFIRCWSWIDLDMQVVIYPKPMTLPHLPSSNVEGDGKHANHRVGNDDFHGFKHYEAGDSLKKVDWRGFAKGQALQSKVFMAQGDERCWVDWYAIPHHDVEQCLSYLCGWVLALERLHKSYGLRLPNIEIKPAQGQVHKRRVLSVLALYQLPKNERA